MADDADEIITLESGEQVRVTADGSRYLISTPSPLMDQVVTEAEQRREEQVKIDQFQANLITRKQKSMDANPTIPPEKRIF